MSPADIVATTEVVAGDFGRDIAHDVCCIFLEKRPKLTDEPLRWWRRTARYLRNGGKDKSDVRCAPRYWLEAKWATTRRTATPEQWAACWELIDRVPAEVVVQLVQMEDVRGDHTRALMAHHCLRRHALRYSQGGDHEPR
jgi:hypothetical protein